MNVARDFLILLILPQLGLAHVSFQRSASTDQYARGRIRLLSKWSAKVDSEPLKGYFQWELYKLKIFYKVVRKSGQIYTLNGHELNFWMADAKAISFALASAQSVTFPVNLLQKPYFNLLHLSSLSITQLPEPYYLIW